MVKAHVSIKAYFLIILLLSASLFSSQERTETPINYKTSGYIESNSSNILEVNVTPTDVLVPSVKGQMGVSETGALTYTLPVETVKGLNDFQPNLALVYNSQYGNGQAGWGWNIVGLSSITRGGKSKEIDGLTIGPQFNDSDPYYLDGQRLIKINETTYETEKFSKVKITLQSSGISQFNILYPDGKIAKYIEIVSGQFYISTIIDSFNNEVHYTYEVLNNVPVITKISYGGTSPDNDIYYINFIYKARKKNQKIFRNGISYINSKVLSEIRTGSLNIPIYRKYQIFHDYIEDNSIERIRTILVNNQAGENLKPLNFNYNQSSSGSITISNSSSSALGSGTTGLGSVAVGSFFANDQERLRPIFQERRSNGYLLNSGSVSINDISVNNSGTLLFSGKVLDLTNRITEKDQLIVVNEAAIGTPDLNDPNASINQQLKDEITFEIKDLVTGDLRSIKLAVRGGLVDIVNYIPPDPYDPSSTGSSVTYARDEGRRVYLQGDYNNDGLVDFLIIESQNLNRGHRVYFVEIGKQNSGISLEVNPVVLNETIDLTHSDIYAIEFDGDGLLELLIVNKYSAKCAVYKINFNTSTLDPIISDFPLSNFGINTPVYLGDFNGDGLTDFLTPQTVYEIPLDDNSGVKMGNVYYKMQTDNLLWWKYTSNGQSFSKIQEDYTQQKIAYLKPSQNNSIKRSTFWQKFWNGMPDEYAFTRYSTNNIFITDFNKDGRSDIVTVNKIGKAKYSASGSLANAIVDNLSNILFRKEGASPLTSFTSSITNKINFYENKNLQGGTFDQISSLSIEQEKISPISLFLSSENLDLLNGSHVGVFIYDAITGNTKRITVNNSKFLEKQIQEVDNGTEVKQKVEYRNMHPELLYYYSYNPGELTYIYKYQDQLKYPYFVHKYNPALLLVNKIHTVFDGQILTNEYRYENGIQHMEGKGFIGFQKTYSSDSYESEIKDAKYINRNPGKAVFWNITTREPEMDNALLKSTYGGINNYFTENLFTNKKFDLGNHRYLILATEESSEDYLKKIKIKKKYIYDDTNDLKLKTVHTDYDGVGSSSSNYLYSAEYFANGHYFYGQIASVENILYKGGLSFTTKEESTYYQNGSVYELKRYGNQSGAPPIVTSYTYDNYGNIKSETLSASGVATRTTLYDYDPTNRFVVRTTTPDGLFSTKVVNILGQTISEVSSLGLNSTYSYDTWGNITEISDFLGKKTTFYRSVAGSGSSGLYNLHKKHEGGQESIVTFDKFDREIQSKSEFLENKWIIVKTAYDIFGKKTAYTEPYYEGNPSKWNIIEYDELNRPVKHTDYKGLSITTCYEGLKITVDDLHNKKTSTTLDAMGHTIRHQDRGGVISFSHFPNGALRETNYEGIITSYEIDGWGNKTKMIDPSAGTYLFEYDILGRIKKEHSPKGYTIYSYDDLDRLVTEKTYGNAIADNTNIEKTFTYDGLTKLPKTIEGLSNGKSFKYTTYYDQYFRIQGKKEETPDFTYSSYSTFDSFGRPDVINTETKLVNSTYVSSSSVKNIYSAKGFLIQQNDNDSGSMIWHVSDMDAKGQIKQAEFGNGFTLTNQYQDLDYSLSNIKHQHNSNGNIALDVDYNYNTNHGVLNFRKNKIFAKKEDFTYDKLARLLTEAVNGVITNEYTYDRRGRITSNSQLGKYNYNEQSYKLQGIVFNTNGKEVNLQRGFPTVSYNAFKSPLRIYISGKEDLEFDYSILKTRYSMKSAVTGKQKWYSSDFAVEITREQNSNKTEIITYLTGDPYSANYLKKEILIAGEISEKNNYYLHRDNLGSILAISTLDGSVIEQRFFDAWGNLNGLVNAVGQVISDPVALYNQPLFIDRGYTGHEHLWKVGLVNMNARLYDPILRKFLSPDNLIQDPFNTQNYDRFGYVYNNPLLYVDIDGNEITLATAIIISVAIAITTKAIANMISGIPIWYGMGKAAVMGAVSGAVSFGIGVAATSFGQGISIGKAIFEAGAHAISSGTMAAIDGQFGGSAFIAGAISSIMASSVTSLGINFGASDAHDTVYNGFGKEYMKATMIVVGGLSGGISSLIAGGKFLDGLRQGITTSGLNHLAHLTVSTIQRSTRQSALLRLKRDTPRFYQVLEKIPEFLEANPKVLATLAKDTGLTKEQILSFMDVKSTEGQIIKTAKFVLKDPTNRRFGQANNKISYIEHDLIMTFETLQTPAFIQGTSFLLAITVLHEFVHWGRTYNILSSNRPNRDDYGTYWERRTFGTVVGINDRTIELSYEYGWKF